MRSYIPRRESGEKTLEMYRNLEPKKLSQVRLINTYFINVRAYCNLKRLDP